MRTLLSAFALLIGLCFSGYGVAESLPAPTGKVILTVSGDISLTNSDEGADFDIALLESLPQHHFITATPWTEGESRYDGVLLNELLKHLNANGQKLTAVALNDYKVHFELAEVKDVPVMLAYKKDGQYMRVRNKGPIWILYPMSDYPELDKPKHHANMVWQLRKLRVD